MTSSSDLSKKVENDREGRIERERERERERELERECQRERERKRERVRERERKQEDQLMMKVPSLRSSEIQAEGGIYETLLFRIRLIKGVKF